MLSHSKDVLIVPSNDALFESMLPSSSAAAMWWREYGDLQIASYMA